MGRWVRRWIARIRTAGAITFTQLRHQKLRLGLAIIGISLAVLAMTLLVGTGVGVIETGEQQFDTADRDLWMTAGETRLTPTGGGGFQNTLYDSRSVSENVSQHDGVRNAVPLAFQTVYVTTEDKEEFRTFVGSGTPASGSSVQVIDGESFGGDPHYAGGTYDGERTGEVLIDRETAQRLDVEIGDTLYVGGSYAAARENEVTVVGISPTFEQMLGAPTVVMPLSELHQATGSTQTEPATFITITLEDDADLDAVQRDLQAQYPEYEIRSNQEQLEAVLQEQVLVLAAGFTLVVLAIGAGIALTVNLLALVIYQQRHAFAVLRAQGLSSSLLVLSVVGQGLAIGVIGGLLGGLLTPPSVSLLNRMTVAVVGFDGLVQLEPRLIAGSIVLAIAIGTVAAAIAGWRISRTPPLEYL
ncbi:ABC transporter permease [Natrarchaeobius chitinivorans]|uniref:ABC transporter permease n=1 Tax=Natrarchaeobius chitinivorans TaxID=1679083 RepID=A0A3N6MGV2_NATCH|nr:ABC transporter permease [Natrarchaeobius chitinivorans]RQG96070.1 ABC transporter permease [Natrarchaeobius chitinivorans]